MEVTIYVENMDDYWNVACLAYDPDDEDDQGEFTLDTRDFSTKQKAEEFARWFFNAAIEDGDDVTVLINGNAQNWRPTRRNPMGAKYRVRGAYREWPHEQIEYTRNEPLDSRLRAHQLAKKAQQDDPTVDVWVGVYDPVRGRYHDEAPGKPINSDVFYGPTRKNPYGVRYPRNLKEKLSSTIAHVQRGARARTLNENRVPEEFVARVTEALRIAKKLGLPPSAVEGYTDGGAVPNNYKFRAETTAVIFQNCEFAVERRRAKTGPYGRALNDYVRIAGCRAGTAAGEKARDMGLRLHGGYAYL